MNNVPESIYRKCHWHSFGFILNKPKYWNCSTENVHIISIEMLDSFRLSMRLWKFGWLWKHTKCIKCCNIVSASYDWAHFVRNIQKIELPLPSRLNRWREHKIFDRIKYACIQLNGINIWSSPLRIHTTLPSTNT